MKKILILVFGLLLSTQVFAQSLNVVKGKVLDADTNQPIEGVNVLVVDTDVSQKTATDGTFKLQSMPKGKQIVSLKKIGYEAQFFPIVVGEKDINLDVIFLYIDVNQQVDNSIVSISDDDLSDDEAGGSDNVAGILQSSKDVYQRAVAFNFGQVWFKERGYDSSYGQVSFNGMPMNKISNNRPQWSDWGGLNDVLRNQTFTNGLAPSETTFGNVLGTTNFNTRASEYREGGKVSYAFTNSNYNGRFMASYNTGLLEGGWALTVLASRRFAQEAYIDGTSYNAYGSFVAFEKVFNAKHSINLTSFFTPNRRGKSSPNTQEVFDLGGHKYNSYWGYQNGEKRNSRMKEISEPTVMLGHYWTVSDKTSVNTNVMYQTGSIGNSRLGYLAGNPDPTYYHNLPSYELRKPGQEDYEAAYIKEQYFLNGTHESQLEWDELYDANLTNGGNAVYMQYQDVNEDTVLAINSVINSQISDNITLNGSVVYKDITSENYAKMMDLLGADYYTDLDRYSFGDEAQMDLNNPDRQVVENEKFNYNYIIDASVLDAFAQGQFSYDKIDFYLSGNIGNTSYQREGLYKNGSYADNSFGKGEKLDFLTYGAKTGFTYKLSGRHLFNINGGYMTKAPSLRNTYSNSRVNHDVVTDIDTEKILSFDASYIFRAPGVKARLSGYYTEFKDLNEVSFFFAQGISLAGFDLPSDVTGDAFFLNTALTGVNKKNIGGELGLEVQVTPTISLTGVAALGQFTYDNNPELYIGSDQFSSTLLGTAYLENYKQSGTPQRGYSAGFSYRDPNYWWVSANANLLSNNYISISPILRTDNFYTDPFGNAVPFNELTQDQIDTALAQEKFDDIFLVNVVGGKSWKVNDKYLGFFASINNVLGEEFKTGGFEQSRKANFEELSADRALETPTFGNKYWYGRSTSYYLNFYVRF